ncbi:MAG: (Fe-S)-binding protein [Chloroflexota bacterium]
MRELEAAVERCNGCGFCQAACPVYKVTGIEWTVARGRVALLKAALQGRAHIGEEIREPMFNCLTCGGCTDHCPPGVPTAEIVTQAREELVRRQGLPWVQKLAFDGVLPRPSLLWAAVRMVWLGQITGLEPLARASGILGAMGLQDAAEALPRLPSSTGRAQAEAALRLVRERRYRVAYFLGCGTNNVFPDTAGATVRVLQRQGVEVVLPEAVCCGKPPVSYGDAESARSLARRNIEAFSDLDVDAIVTDCATCGSFLREYGSLIKGAGAYAEKAAKLSAKVKDVLGFLGEIGVDNRFGKVKAKVTYHDPCHLGRFQKTTKAPRDLLKSVPGIVYTEMNEANMCCGGAGSYSITHPEISRHVLERKLANATRTGAQVLATACPGCAMQLSSGILRQSLPLRVTNVIQVLDQAYQSAG